jgi:hypothetical protein
MYTHVFMSYNENNDFYLTVIYSFRDFVRHTVTVLYTLHISISPSSVIIPPMNTCSDSTRKMYAAYIYKGIYVYTHINLCVSVLCVCVFVCVLRKE